MQKIILDTNVLVSSLISSRGVPSKIMEYVVFEELVHLCISESILQEYFDVIHRKKFKPYEGFAQRGKFVLGLIQLNALKFEPSEKVDNLKDKSDNKFLELAIEANADYLITGNINDFGIQEIRNTKIVSPDDYWKFYKPMQ